MKRGAFLPLFSLYYNYIVPCKSNNALTTLLHKYFQNSPCYKFFTQGEVFEICVLYFPPLKFNIKTLHYKHLLLVSHF